MLDKMKKSVTLLIFALIISFFLSCDGRNRIHKSPETILTESKLLDSFSEEIKYYPEELQKIKTDTILSNGFRLKINLTTDMTNSVLNEFKSANKNNKHYYRHNIALVTIYHNEKLLFSEKITKKLITKTDNKTNNFIEKSILESVWLDTNSNNKNFVKINVLYSIPSTKDSKLYVFKFNKDKTYSIEHIPQ